MKRRKGGMKGTVMGRDAIEGRRDRVMMRIGGLMRSLKLIFDG